MKLLIISIACMILLQLSLLGRVTCQSKVKAKSVYTHLNAKWPNTPYMLEAAEFLAEESTSTLWTFIDAINSLNLEDYEKMSERQKFDVVIESAGQHLTVNRINLLKFSLSLRVYSPKIELFRQIADERGVLAKNCNAVLEINNNIYCDVEPLNNLPNNATNGNATVLDVDHIYPGSEASNTVAILYGELGTPELRDFHNKLKGMAQSATIKYVFRPIVKKPLPHKVRLSGYGVELQIKSTEYKAQDDTKLHDDGVGVDSSQDEQQEIEGFIFSKLRTLHPDHDEDFVSLANYLNEANDDMAPMKVWQLQHLSMQAAQRIMSSRKDELLSTFVHLSQNFPVLARSLSRTKVNEKMKREIIKNQAMLHNEIGIGPTDSVLFVNGMQLDLNYIDMYSLFNIISDEQRVMEGLFAMGIKDDMQKSLLKMDLTEAKVEYGIDIRDSAVTWLNNIETDKSYKRWPQSVNELMRPTFPGMMRSVRKNFHNLVAVLDPKNKESADILRFMESFITHLTPIRFGVVLAVEPDKKISGLKDVGVAMLCAFNFISQASDGEDANLKGINFLIDVYSASSSGTPSVSDVTKLFGSRFRSEDLEDVFGQDSDYDVGRQLSKIMIDKAGFRSFPQALMNGVPLSEKMIGTDEIEETILMEVMTNTQRMQRAVFKGELTDSNDVVDWLMAQPNIMSRLNDRILQNKGSTFIDLAGSTEKDVTPSAYTAFAGLSDAEMTASIAESCHYLTTKAERTLRPLTIWLASDFESVAGRMTLLDAIKYTRESNSVRFCFLNSAAEPGFFSRILHVAHSALSAPVARQVLIKIMDDKHFTDVMSGQKSLKDFTITGFNAEGFESRVANVNMDVFRSQRLYLSKVLGITPGKSTVVANGRVLGLLSDNELFTEEDFSLLENYFMSYMGDKVAEQLKDYPAYDISDVIMQASGILMSITHKTPRIEVPIKGDVHSVIKLNATDDTRPSFNLIAVCDPISAAAQQIGPILQVLHSVLNANVKVVLNGREKHSEMPLKSFYRYVLQAEPQFTDDGVAAAGPFARFIGLPESTILTQSFHIPDNWLVEVVKSVHDLDNIKLELVDTAVTSEFELEHLLLEGHCFEQATGNPPRGLQFTLGTKENPIMVDTIVMANLGYFQLKGNPGNMILRLREGRSSDIYTIFSHEKHTQRRDEPTIRNVNNEVGVVISSFRPHVIKIRVSKKPEMAEQDLLNDEDEDSGGIWGSIASTFTSSNNKKDDGSDDTINIFSVASGHLYERFIRIMMLSVRKHTTSKIKFWLIKNFLSPNLKDSLPVLAKEFDFEYELVQYKWPRWLHQQTEKQRVIWGYKILFLDVLFPLNVTKIIFVDADQVVRDDLQKLRDLDLDGAPYGFVPFCDSRKEMEGFRFWKQGYWRNHLASRKYHISALFVVDLKKFRRIAAGDRLRGQYQGLSADPNSLSNLDQDLPNNMIHQVRIKSLPMEWLWCETWCDDDSKKQAKVIDLCNNPLTKEAKLDAANRIIQEWGDYDVTIKSALSRLGKEESIGAQPAQEGANIHKHQEL